MQDIQVKPQKPFREWQIRALDELLAKKRILFEVATGAGKSYFFCAALQKLFAINPNYSVVIVVPKNVILEDTWFRELIDAGFPITKIGFYYGAAKEIRQITLTNIQSIERLDMNRFDIVVADECHHLNTNRLFDLFKRLRPEYFVGLSATVQRKKAEHWNVLHLFDYNVFSYDVSQAINDDILSNFYYCPVAVSLSPEQLEEYQKLTQQIKNKVHTKATLDEDVSFMSLVSQQKKIMSNSEMKRKAVQLLLSQLQNKKVIVFSQYNDFTNSLYWSLVQVNVRAEVLHSGLPRKRQQQILDDYRSGVFSILLVTKMLDEGYNLPAIDCAIITATDKSELQMIQRLGRILRRKEHPALMYQIYCQSTLEEQIVQRNMKYFEQFCEGIKCYSIDGNYQTVIEE